MYEMIFYSFRQPFEKISKTYINCATKGKEKCECCYNKLSIGIFWMSLCARARVYSSQVFNFRCLLFAFSLLCYPFFSCGTSLLWPFFAHPSLTSVSNVLTHFLFNRIFDSIQVKLNTLVFYANRNSFDRMASKTTTTLLWSIIYIVINSIHSKKGEM